MKRSHTVSLTLMSASAVLLQACDEPQVEAGVYRDIKQCIDSGQLTEQQCMDLHRAALDAHLNNAPRFRSKEECYAEYGYEQCEQQAGQQAANNNSGGSFWTPLLMGFVASRVLDSVTGGNRSATPLYRTSRDPNTLRNAKNYPVSKGYGQAKLPKWATEPTRTRTKAVSRGGFGGRSSGWGRWGG